MQRERLAAVSNAVVRPAIRRKTALGRDLLTARSASVVAAALHWVPGEAGRQTAMIQLVSAQATGVRVGLRIDRLPDAAQVRFHVPGGEVEHVFGGAAINATISRNRAAGDFTEAGAMFWSPFLEGEQVNVEIDVPAEYDVAHIGVAVPKLSHFVESPKADPTVNEARIGESSRCNIDANCNGTWTAQNNAVAKTLFTDATGESFTCSGTLLNDRAASGTPYFLTAHHCITSQTEASSLETYWFYRSSSCNVLSLASTSVQRSGGATLLYSSSSTDTSFLRLLSAPPFGVVYAGWATSPVALGTSVAGLHHPEGDLLKISTGTLRSFQSCQGLSTVDESFTCDNGTVASSGFFDVNFTSGTTESGSSGSGIFADVVGSGKVLLGQLYGGTSSCRNRSGTNIYGRFDVAYTAALSRWLDAAPVAATVTPENGWWWNAAEAGRGFAIEQQGTRIFIGGFLYETSGAAVWYVATLSQQSDGTYTGEFARYTGGQALGASYRAPSAPVKVADIVLSFATSTSGSLKVTPVSGSASVISLRRFPISSPTSFAASAASFQNGWWWNASEGGRGYFIEVQGSQSFISIFAYETTGLPAWYVTTATLTGSQGLSGSLLQYSGGQSLQGSYKSASLAATTGALQFVATSATTGILTLPNGQQVSVQRFTF